MSWLSPHQGEISTNLRGKTWVSQMISFPLFSSNIWECWNTEIQPFGTTIGYYLPNNICRRSIKRNQTKIRTNYSICCVFLSLIPCRYHFVPPFSMCSVCFSETTMHHLFPPDIFIWAGLTGHMGILTTSCWQDLGLIKGRGVGDGRGGRNNNMGEKKWWL